MKREEQDETSIDKILFRHFLHDFKSGRKWDNHRLELAFLYVLNFYKRNCSFYFSLSYSSSLTGSSHSFEVFSPGTPKARWANQLSLAAPCQCFTPAGMWMTVPGSISCAGFPSS